MFDGERAWHGGALPVPHSKRTWLRLRLVGTFAAIAPAFSFPGERVVVLLAWAGVTSDGGRGIWGVGRITVWSSEAEAVLKSTVSL